VKKILFETHHLYYWPNFDPIVRELKVRGSYIIHASMPKRSSDIQQNIFIKVCSDMKVEFIAAESEKDRVEKIFREAYDIIIVANVGQIKKLLHPNSLAVMVYHGIGLKQSYYKDIDNCINIRAVESIERFNELEDIGHKNLALTGFTKLDKLYTMTEKETRSIKKNLNLIPGKNIILYAPSFYPTSIEKLYSQLSILSNDNNIIIIKLHGFSWEQERFQYQSIMCSKLAEKHDSIILLPNETYDILPFYKIADLLISDISSTMFEFLPLDRPIIQAQCFTLRLKHRIFSGRFWEKIDVERMQDAHFAYKIVDPNDLIGRVQFALEFPDEMSTLRKDAHEQYLYKPDGRSSARLVDAIEEKIK